MDAAMQSRLVSTNPAVRDGALAELAALPLAQVVVRKSALGRPDLVKPAEGGHKDLPRLLPQTVLEQVNFDVVAHPPDRFYASWRLAGNSNNGAQFGFRDGFTAAKGWAAALVYGNHEALMSVAFLTRTMLVDHLARVMELPVGDADRLLVTDAQCEDPGSWVRSLVAALVVVSVVVTKGDTFGNPRMAEGHLRRLRDLLRSGSVLHRQGDDYHRALFDGFWGAGNVVEPNASQWMAAVVNFCIQGDLHGILPLLANRVMHRPRVMGDPAAAPVAPKPSLDAVKASVQYRVESMAMSMGLLYRANKEALLIATNNQRTAGEAYEGTMRTVTQLERVQERLYPGKPLPSWLTGAAACALLASCSLEKRADHDALEEGSGLVNQLVVVLNECAPHQPSDTAAAFPLSTPVLAQVRAFNVDLAARRAAGTSEEAALVEAAQKAQADAEALERTYCSTAPSAPRTAYIIAAGAAGDRGRAGFVAGPPHPSPVFTESQEWMMHGESLRSAEQALHPQYIAGKTWALFLQALQCMLAMLRGGSVLDGQRSPHAMVPVVDVHGVDGLKSMEWGTDQAMATPSAYKAARELAKKNPYGPFAKDAGRAAVEAKAMELAVMRFAEDLSLSEQHIAVELPAALSDLLRGLGDDAGAALLLGMAKRMEVLLARFCDEYAASERLLQYANADDPYSREHDGTYGSRLTAGQRVSGSIVPLALTRVGGSSLRAVFDVSVSTRQALGALTFLRLLLWGEAGLQAATLPQLLATHHMAVGTRDVAKDRVVAIMRREHDRLHVSAGAAAARARLLHTATSVVRGAGMTSLLAGAELGGLVPLLTPEELAGAAARAQSGAPLFPLKQCLRDVLLPAGQTFNLSFSVVANTMYARELLRGSRMELQKYNRDGSTAVIMEVVMYARDGTRVQASIISYCASKWNNPPPRLEATRATSMRELLPAVRAMKKSAPAAAVAPGGAAAAPGGWQPEDYALRELIHGKVWTVVLPACCCGYIPGAVVDWHVPFVLLSLERLPPPP